jgi:hypothetical protein
MQLPHDKKSQGIWYIDLTIQTQKKRGIKKTNMIKYKNRSRVYNLPDAM